MPRSNLQGNKSIAKEMSIQEWGMEISMLRGRVQELSLREELEECRFLINQNIEQNFWRACDPDGSPWPPRKELGDGHPLLIDTMTLILAATGQGPGSIQVVTDRSLTMTIDLSVVPYARAQDKGFPPNNLPARNYFGASAATQRRCRSIITKGMKRKLWQRA